MAGEGRGGGGLGSSSPLRKSAGRPAVCRISRDCALHPRRQEALFSALLLGAVSEGSGRAAEEGCRQPLRCSAAAFSAASRFLLVVYVTPKVAASAV